MNLFYDLNKPVTYDVPDTKACGKTLDINNTWDFYTDDGHKLPYVSGNVRGVKMWRKPDFDRLVKRAKELSIIVEKCPEE